MKHEILETRAGLLGVLIAVVISVGGLVEIVPLYFSSQVTSPAPGVKPYTALQLEGRDIYIREGCYNCHSQMIRPFRWEQQRYGEPSKMEESQFDHPFQWGSKRTGPDLSRIGGKYSDEWHRAHLDDPRSVVPESVMPPYAFLATTPLDYREIEAELAANRAVGVPYTKDMIDNAKADLEAQANPDSDGAAKLAKRYPKVQIRDFDGNPKMISEADALIAYMQMLGTLVDFSTYKADAPENKR